MKETKMMMGGNGAGWTTTIISYSKDFASTYCSQPAVFNFILSDCTISWWYDCAASCHIQCLYYIWQSDYFPCLNLDRLLFPGQLSSLSAQTGSVLFGLVFLAHSALTRVAAQKQLVKKKRRLNLPRPALHKHKLFARADGWYLKVALIVSFGWFVIRNQF